MKYYVIAILAIFTIESYSQSAQAPDSLWSDAVQQLQKGNNLYGLDLLDNYLRLKPLNKEAYYTKGLTLLKLGNKDEACKSLNKANELGNKKNKKWINHYCNVNSLIEYYVIYIIKVMT